MKIQSFKERMSTTLWWVSGLTLIFLIVGAGVVSDISFDAKYDSVKAYNLFKDSLSFGATILTPIVAVVFFSDWREQHVETELESKSWVLYQHVENLFWKLAKYESEIQDTDNLKLEKASEIEEKQEALSNEIFILGNLIDDLDRNDTRIDQIVNLAKEIKQGLRNELFYLEKAYFAIARLNNPEEYLIDYKETRAELASHFSTEYVIANQGWVDSYAITRELIDQLKPLVKSLKIQA